MNPSRVESERTIASERTKTGAAAISTSSFQCVHSRARAADTIARACSSVEPTLRARARQRKIAGLLILAPAAFVVFRAYGPVCIASLTCYIHNSFIWTRWLEVAPTPRSLG